MLPEETKTLPITSTLDAQSIDSRFPEINGDKQGLNRSTVAEPISEFQIKTEVLPKNLAQNSATYAQECELKDVQSSEGHKSLITNVNLVDIQNSLNEDAKSIDRAQFYIGESDDEIIVNTKYEEMGFSSISEINDPSCNLKKSKIDEQTCDILEVHVDKSETEHSEKLYETDCNLPHEVACDKETMIGDIKILSKKNESENYIQGESDDTRSESDVTPDSDPNNKIPISTEEDLKQDGNSSYEIVDKLVFNENISNKQSKEISDQFLAESFEENEDENEEMSRNEFEIHLQEPEARSMAIELVDYIKNEVDNRELVSGAFTDIEKSETSQVSNYLKELAIEKGLDTREIQLIESVLARKNKDLGKIVRNDTQTSSMEITDEDLRSSGVETDYSPTESQVLLNNQQANYSAEVADIRAVEKTLAEVKESLEAAQDVLIEVSKDGGYVKKQSPSEFEFKVLSQGKKFDDVIEESYEDNQLQLEKELYSPKKVRIHNANSQEKTTANVTYKNMSKQIINTSNNLAQYDDTINEVQLGKILETDLQNMLAKDKIRKEKNQHAEQNIPMLGLDNQLLCTKLDQRTEDDQSQISEIVLRKKSTVKEKSSLTPKSDKRSGAETETCSSSGESHYNSFEQTDSLRSRPCSSDIDGLMVATGSSEYESALTSQEVSSKPIGSSEYHTAINSLSSRESMKSLDSESSGNIASLEVSDASETLVPAAQELELDICEETDKSLSDYQTNFLLDDKNKIELKNVESADDPSEISDDIPKHANLHIDGDVFIVKNNPESDYNNIPHGMKRSQEMTFQPEPKTIKSDSPQSEVVIETATEFDDKYASSLDEGTALSMSLSSLSETSGLRTVIDMYESDIERSSLSSSIPVEDVLSDQQEKMFSMPSWQNLTTISADYKVSEVSAEKETQNTVTRDITCTKVKGHRRNDSLSSFHPSKIPIKRNKIEQPKILDDAVSESIVNLTEVDVAEMTSEINCHAHSGYATTPERVFTEEAEAEAAFHMVPHMSPTHQTKIIDTIIEDTDAEKIELEVAAKQTIDTVYSITGNAGAIPDITVTEHMTPLASAIFQYPDNISENKQVQKSTPETPISFSSKSSEETDHGQEYILGDCASDGKIPDKPLIKKKRISPTDSPTSDSFEIIEKPDITDDFVVIEEVAKEAHEFDSEGKSLIITQTKFIKKHDTELEEYIVKSAPELTNSSNRNLKSSDYDFGPFDFEDSPPNADKKHSDQTDTKNNAYMQSDYEKDADLNKKWVETQIKGDPNASSSYRYDIEYEHGPLEDIKEEEIHDFDQAASRIGSMGSQKESVGSLSKDSYSSTPEYDVLAGKKFFTRSGDHDDISMNSLQEFENLEQAISLENKKIHHGSQDSLSNGSFTRRYYLSRSGQGDDISLSSLKEFEGLETACIEAHKIETKAKEEEAQLLSQIPEGPESQEKFAQKHRADNPDVEKKNMYEIDEIIRQAQDNVQKFIDNNEIKSVGTIQTDKVVKHYEWCDPMKTSTDSLELKHSEMMSDSILRTSTDSLDIRSSIGDNMTASTDSIDSQMQSANKILESGTNEEKTIIDYLNEPSQKNVAFVELGDSIDEDGSRLEGNLSIDRHDSYSSGKDGDSSFIGQDDHLSDPQQNDNLDVMRDTMLGSTDSLEPTSSTATHATYQYETDSVMSGSFTSGGSNTMVSSIDHFDQISDDLAIKKVWFEDCTEASYSDVIAPSKPYVSEVIEPCDEEGFYKIIHRTVGLPPEIRKVTFTGSNAEKDMQNYVSNFNEGEEMHEFKEVDEHGNVHIKRVIQKRMILQPNEDYKFSDLGVSDYGVHQSSSSAKTTSDSKLRHYPDDTDHGFLNPEEGMANIDSSAAASFTNTKGRLTNLTQLSSKNNACKNINNCNLQV